MAGVNEPHTPKGRLLGAELRHLRQQNNLNVRQLAAALGVGQATVSRYERGERTPPMDYVARVLGTLGVTGVKYDEIIDFARTATEPNMITKGSGGMHRHLIELSELDRTAERVVHVAPLLIPGPMQTREYARAVMAMHSQDERDVRVEMRMARTAALSQPASVEAVLLERTLRDALGGTAVMAAQIRHLIQISHQSNVTIRIIPADLGRWTLAHDGAFVLYEFAKASPIVHVEHFRGPAFIYERDDVRAYSEATDTLFDAAMGPVASNQLMSTIERQLEGTSQAC